MSGVYGRAVRAFNPGTFQSDGDVIEQFVVRRNELSAVLDILRRNVDAESCQHTLIVAPRGRGKTMLLARVAAELRADAELAAHLLPVRFMEESHEVFSAADFWLDVLFHLALAVNRQDPDLARNLRDTHADLASRWRERELDERAQVAALEVAERLGKQLVLMVENMQALCGNVDDDFGWKLRKTLQTEPQIILLATATSRFEALDDAREPFFELFRVIGLRPLDTAQCRCLWRALSGDEISEHEIRPLEILTGGDPRLLVIAAEFSLHRSIRQLMEHLVKLIDDHTEYFRGHLETIGKTERRVYLALIDLWQPSTAGEIAARARLDIRPVSTMLGRLVNRGAVLRRPAGSQRLYTVAQRLYCIYYKLRRERDEAAIVTNLLRFMTAFYSDSVERELADTLTRAAQRSNEIREGSGDGWATAAWKAPYDRMAGHAAGGRGTAAADEFRSLYAALAPDTEAVAPVTKGVALLLAAGVPESEVVAILRTEPEKAAALAPLIIALRLRAGEAVRAPAEVLEVAADVRQRIAEPRSVAGAGYR